MVIGCNVEYGSVLVVVKDNVMLGDAMPDDVVSEVVMDSDDDAMLLVLLAGVPTPTQ